MAQNLQKDERGETVEEKERKKDENGSCVLKFGGGFRGPRNLKIELPSRRELVFHFLFFSKNVLKQRAGVVGFEGVWGRFCGILGRLGSVLRDFGVPGNVAGPS